MALELYDEFGTFAGSPEEIMEQKRDLYANDASFRRYLNTETAEILRGIETHTLTLLRDMHSMAPGSDEYVAAVQQISNMSATCAKLRAFYSGFESGQLEDKVLEASERVDTLIELLDTDLEYL